ncbi:MAG: phosphatase PAP2 family protein [Ferruginibacter sp.]
MHIHHPGKYLLLILFAHLSFFTVCAQANNISDSSFPVVKEKKSYKKFILPAALITAGSVGTITNWGINHTVREERNRSYGSFNTDIDDYLQHAPLPVVFIMDAVGLKGRNNWQQQVLLLVTSEVFMFGMVQPVKKMFHVMRPDSSGNNSFPSGHTAQAFLAASFFNKEFGSKYPWVSAGMYAVATSVGVFRIINNRHWVSDVLAGTGIGMLSVELSYLLEKKFKSLLGKNITAVIPSYQNGRLMCTAFLKL